MADRCCRPAWPLWCALAPGVPFGDGVRLTAGMMAKIPPERIGRILYGKAATHLILRFRKSRRRAGE
jgi:hypothetical protein